MKSERPEDNSQTGAPLAPAARADPRRRGRTSRLLRPAPLIVSILTTILLIWIAGAVAAAVGSVLVGIMAACLVILAGLIALTSVGHGSKRTRR